MTEIEKFNPCEEAMQFRNQFTNFKDAWEACHRGDWMLWIAFRLKVDIRVFTLAKAHCANTVRYLMKDERSINAVDVAIKFGNNEATDEELRDAAYAAADAAAAADAYTYAAYAAYAATAAAYAAYAADAADAYAAYAADAYALTKNQLETAEICRKYLTSAVFSKLELL